VCVCVDAHTSTHTCVRKMHTRRGTMSIGGGGGGGGVCGRTPLEFYTYIRVYIFADILTHSYTHKHIHKHTPTHTRKRPSTCVYAYTYTYTYMHPHTRIHIRIHIHVYIYAFTYTHTHICIPHTHTHTNSLSLSLSRRTPFDFSPTSAKKILTAFSRAQIRDSELYAHLVMIK
jgi:hypothetical protein